MTRRAELLALAARVEAAAEPSIDLDRQVSRAVGWIGVHLTLFGDGLLGRPHKYAGWRLVPHFFGAKDAAALRAMAEEVGDE